MFLSVNFSHQNADLDAVFAQDAELSIVFSELCRADMSEEALAEAIAMALHQAKVSGMFDGKDGESVLIEKIELSADPGGVSIVTFSTGEELRILNGINGKDGYTPVKGVDYTDGKDGYTPIKGVDYTDGKDGIDGYTPVKGVDYTDGKPGHTPVKGTDYFTSAEKAEMVQDVIDALPLYDGEAVIT